MSSIKIQSYKFAKEIIQTKPELEEEIKHSIERMLNPLTDLTRQKMNERMDIFLRVAGWNSSYFIKKGIDLEYYKKNVALKVRTGHPSFIGSDLLEFELARMSNYIDVGVYVCVTSNFRKKMISDYKLKWEGSLTFEKAQIEIEHYSKLINLPILLIGIDI